jgi:Asp-tRNA(Asn)/Glu-tRNA(Gln) amidotransferase A subunit family amidase
MPFGIQILGAPGKDHLILEVAKAIEFVLSGHTETTRPLPNIEALLS